MQTMFRFIAFILFLFIIYTECEDKSKEFSVLKPRHKFQEEQKGLHSPKVVLNNGQQMPIAGFGTFSLANGINAVNVIMEAIEVGYRLIDTAAQYENEQAVGRAVNSMIALGYVKREDLFVTTKIWNTYHGRELVHNQTRMSLDKMGLEFVNLLLMHYPTGYKYFEYNPKLWFPKYPNGTTIPRNWQKDAWIDTWKGMEDMVKKGWAKAIGISNFNAQQMDKLLSVAEIKPVVNQVEINPFHHNKKIVLHCHKLGIWPKAYSPLHRDIPNDPVIQKIAQRVNKTPFQVDLRWLSQRGITFLAKSVQREHMVENMDVFNFNLTDSEMNELKGLTQKPKKIDDKGSYSHPDYPFFESMDSDSNDPFVSNFKIVP